MSELVSYTLMGLLLGGLYSIIGIGLSIAFGVLKFINLAHGDLLIVGSYLSLALLLGIGMDPLLSLIIVVPALFGIGYVLQRFLFNRVMWRGDFPPLMVAFATSMIIYQVLQIVWTANYRTLATDWSVKSLEIVPGVVVPLIYIVNFIAASILMAMLHLFLNRTYQGKAIRAASEDWEAAELMGINSKNIFSVALGVAMMAAALAGVLVGLTSSFYPAIGPQYLIIAFSVIIIGGLGSMKGTFTGGIIVGLAQILSAKFISPGYQLFVSYIIVLVVLAIRPTGIFGRR